MDHRARGRFLSLLGLLMAMAVAWPPGHAMAASGLPDAVSDARDALDRMADYDYGDSRVPLSALRIAVQASLETEATQRAIEREMVAYLASDATFAGKQFVVEQLSIIGSAAAVPVLVELLRGEGTADLALYALQRIPDAAVDEALLRSLAGAEPGVRVGVVNAMGERGSPSAVRALRRLVAGGEGHVAVAAAGALGKIGGDDAIAVLEAVLEGATGTLRHVALDSYLRCADQLLSAGMNERAARIYGDLYRNEDATSTRSAALRGLVLSDLEGAEGTLLSALRRDNQQLQTVAAGLVRDLPEGLDLGAIIAQIPNLAALTQVQLFSALAARPETGAYEAVLAGTAHHDEEVRSAAITALIAVGSEGDVERLAAAAAFGPTESDRMSARAALDAMPAAAATREMMSRMPSAAPEVRAELVRSLGQRKASEATDLLLHAAADPDPSVRTESFKSLARVAESGHLGALLDLLVGESDGGVRNEAERTLVLMARKYGETAEMARIVLSVLPTIAPGDARGSLIEVLGRAGDTSALPAIQAELASERQEDQRAAIQALSSWPDAGPKDELLRVAGSSADQVNRVLALRGYIELLRIPSERRAAESVELFAGAMDLATETNERRMVLSGLGGVSSHLALRTVAGYLEDSTLRPEAEAACRQIVGQIRLADDEQMAKMFEEGMAEDLERILAISDDERLREWSTEMLDRGR